jgi:hypothetical protein
MNLERVGRLSEAADKDNLWIILGNMPEYYRDIYNLVTFRLPNLDKYRHLRQLYINMMNGFNVMRSEGGERAGNKPKDGIPTCCLDYHFPRLTY